MPKFNLSNDETELVITALTQSFLAIMEHGMCDCGGAECGSTFGSVERQEHLKAADDILRLRNRFESRSK